MNPIDILGELMKAGAGRRGQSSPGTDILKDILGGSPKSSGSGTPSGGSGNTSGGINFPGVFRKGPGSGSSSDSPSASDLEDMLGVGRSNAAPSAPTRTPVPPTSGSRRQDAPSSTIPQGDIFGQEPPKPKPPVLSKEEHEQLVTLIRAMIYAGKSDGRIDAQEQQAIVDKVGNTQPDTIQFLREEFANATTARDFAWSVPFGMETAVYAASIASISIDQRSEINYLKELAHGLRLSPSGCNQIHQQYGIKPIF